MHVRINITIIKFRLSYNHIILIRHLGIIIAIDLCISRLNVVEEEYNCDEEESTEKIKPTPPSTGDLDVFVQYVCERLSKLC